MAFRLTIKGFAKEIFLDKRVEQLAYTYRAAQKSLIRKLRDIDITDFQKARAQILLAQVNREIAMLDQMARKWAKGTIPTAYNFGLDISEDRLRQMGITKYVNMTSAIHTEAVAVLTDNVTLDLLTANQTIKKNTTRFIRATQQQVIEDKQISKAIAEGLIQGETRKEISNRILKDFEKQLKDEKFITINGRNYEPEGYSRMVARSRVAEASNQANVNAALQYGVDLVQVDIHAGSCEMCDHFQGRIYSISGNDPDFPPLDERPPYHPNCYSEDTDVYTASGWKKIRDVAVGEMILSLNPKDFSLENVPVDRKVATKSDTMIHFQSRVADILVTKDHKMFYQTDWNSKHKKYKWQFVDANSLTNCGRFYASSEWSSKDRVSNVFARFLGIWLSEGSVSPRKIGKNLLISIAQSRRVNPDKFSEILEIITQAFPNKKLYVNNNSIRFYDLNLGKYLLQFGKAAHKFVPNEVKMSGKTIIRDFLDCYLMGDGSLRKGKLWKNGKFRDERIYFTSSKRMASDLGELILKVGRRPSYHLQKTKGIVVKHKNGNYIGNHDIWLVRECYSQYISLQNMKIEEIPYGKNAYCLSLQKFHTLLVRRNGKVVWSGNCRHQLLPMTKEALEDRGQMAGAIKFSNSSQKVSSIKQYEEGLYV
jgi:hypothetical protein